MRVALLGFGGVNRAFAWLVATRQEELRHSFGVAPRLVAIARSREAVLPMKAGAAFDWAAVAGSSVDRLATLPGAVIRRGWRLEEILGDRSVDVVVQAIPSTAGEVAQDQLLTALRLGSHAVTATKSGLARRFGELLAGAEGSGRALRYSAATSAALPTVDLVDTALRGTAITAISGALNGTSTFVLSRMEETGCSLATAVGEAQALGIAERDPTQDLDGTDTAAKLVIIVNTVLWRVGEPVVDIDNVAVDGLGGGVEEEVALARGAGRVVRLVGTAQLRPGPPTLTVRPERLATDHPLAAVKGKEKGIVFDTDTMGRITVIGGASSPVGAAAALLRDVLAIFAP